MKKTNIGGQALPNGVMMRSRRFASKARRMPDGSIHATLEKIEHKGSRHPMLLLPLIRGSFGLIEVMWTLVKGLGIRAKVQTLIAIVVSSWVVGFLYKLLFPMFSLRLGSWGTTQSLAAISVYVVMLAMILLSPWARRLMRYHGAEHQCVYAAEEGGPITPESVGRFPLAHPRCGTNLFAMYLISSSFITPILPVMSFLAIIIVQFVLMLLLIGLWCEVIALTRSNRVGRWARLALTPGMWLQRLTVRRPDFGELEVACAAANAVVEAEEKEDIASKKGTPTLSA